MLVKEETQGKVPAQETAELSPENAARTTPECLVDSGSHLQGNLTTADDVLLVGTMEGDLTSTGTVRVTGTVTGNVFGKRVDLLGGTICGNITAQSSIQIEKGSHVTGDLKAGTISLKAGATLRGNVHGGMVCIEFGSVFHGMLNAGQEN